MGYLGNEELGHESLTDSRSRRMNESDLVIDDWNCTHKKRNGALMTRGT